MRNQAAVFATIFFCSRKPAPLLLHFIVRRLAFRPENTAHMPELPEVHTFQQVFNAAALHRPIAEVVVHDDKILRNLGGQAFADHLQGRIFIDSYRRGKYLFAALDQGAHVQLHFGMTGDLFPYAPGEEPSRFERFVWRFTDDTCLGFDDPRKFARILYLENLEKYLVELGLGEDALAITWEEFGGLLEQKKGGLKAFLLNQHHLAGVGNLYADEICFQAQIHPASRIERLSPAQKRRIFDLMKEILGAAVKQLPHYKSYPENWWWGWRVADQPGPNGVGVVRKATIAGRTTYFVEGWQKLYV